jgi:hypothetical protein
MSSAYPHSLLGASLSSEQFKSALKGLSATVSAPPPEPEVKAYPDIVYLNYYALGVSFHFTPLRGYKPPRNAATLADLDADKLALEAVDIYNHRETPTNRSKTSPAFSSSAPAAAPSWSAFSAYPLVFNLPTETSSSSGDTTTTRLEVVPETTGKQLVEVLGEPDRKGGGEGARAGNIGTWVEWTDVGLMVEWKRAVGPNAWEEGAGTPWSVITVFKSGKEVES